MVSSVCYVLDRLWQVRSGMYGARLCGMACCVSGTYLHTYIPRNEWTPTPARRRREWSTGHATGHGPWATETVSIVGDAPAAASTVARPNQRPTASWRGRIHVMLYFTLAHCLRIYSVSASTTEVSRRLTTNEYDDAPVEPRLLSYIYTSTPPSTVFSVH